LWPPFYSNWNLSLRRRHEYNVPLGRSHADLQIREPQPAFYLREPAAGGWQIIRLTSRDDQRLLRLVSTGEFALRDQVPANEARKVQIMRVAGGVFRLQPVAPLESGEYALCSAVPGGLNLSVCYGFGVQR
jgi:hypothetical protein